MLRREIKRVRRRESEAWRKRLRYDVRSIDDANMVYVYVCIDLRMKVRWVWSESKMLFVFSKCLMKVVWQSSCLQVHGIGRCRCTIFNIHDSNKDELRIYDFQFDFTVDYNHYLSCNRC